MEIPDNCQCYCYAIMSSLCFPCQVKVHLLHLTASPHGELIKNVKCQTPKDRSQSPQSAGKDRSQTPTSPTRENGVRTDCENCDYYMTFINKLTSGLCEEKILRMVCSNPCLVSSNFPTAPGGTRRDYTPPSKPSPDDPPISLVTDKIVSHNVTNQKMPSKMSVRSNASSGSKVKEHSLPIKSNQVPAANNLGKKKSEISPDKKPTTPTNLMTTDKMLKRSFDSIAKNRPSPISSRTPSPEKKRPDEGKQVTTVDRKPIKHNAPKNDSQPVKNDSKSSTLQKSLPNPMLSKAPKNDPKARQMTSKEIGKKLSKSEGRGTMVSGKMKSKDASLKTMAPPPNSPVPEKKIMKPSEPNSNSVTKCNEEACEFVPGKTHKPGEGHQVQYMHEEGTKQSAKNEGRKPGSMETGAKKADGNATVGEFFEAALVMEFYQPPQIGARKVGSKPATKPLHVEYGNELSNPNLGGSILREFCQRNSTREEQGVNGDTNETEYNNQQAFYEQKVGGKQQATEEHLPPIHYMILEENVEYLPLEYEDKTTKNKKPSKSSPGSTKKEPKEEKSRKKSRSITDPKNHDISSHGGKSLLPISALVRTDETVLDSKPVRDCGMNGRDAIEYVPGSNEPTYSAKARQREERGCYPMNASTGRDGKDESTTEANLIGGSTQINRVRRESESQRNSIPNDGYNCTPGTYSTKGTRDLYPAKIFKESLRQSMNKDEQRDAREFSTAAKYMTDRTADLRVSKAKRAEEDIQNRMNIDDVRDAREYIPGAPHGLECIPNTSQRTKDDRRYSKINGRDRAQVECMEQIREPISNTEMHAKGRRARLSTDGQDRPVAVGVIKKIRDEIESEYMRKSLEKQKHCDPEYLTTPKKPSDESPMSLGDAGPSHSDDRPSRPCSPIQKKSRSSSRRHSASGTSADGATRVYPQFSEYMNPDSEKYRSKSAGNIVESQSTHDPVEISPVKSRSERGSSKWNCGVCPDDKRVYYHTDSDGKCTSMVIGLPEDGGNSNPHIRINFNKHVKQEIRCYKVDKCEQKFDYRDTGTQCDYDPPGTVSPEGSRPATAKSNKNRVPEKTSAKPLQASEQMSSARPARTIGHQQIYYNRPLMRRSFQ